eukprot:g5664.t1
MSIAHVASMAARPLPAEFVGLPTVDDARYSDGSEGGSSEVEDFALCWGLVVVGTVIFSVLEDHGIVDGLYLTCITLTTVGFGDLRPSNPASKLFMCVFSFLGIGVLSTFVGDRGFVVRSLRRRVPRDFELRGACLLLLPTLLAGAVIFVYIEGFGWLDGFYFSVQTATTVGYGDVHVKSDAGKVLVVAYTFCSLGVAGFFTNVVGHRLRGALLQRDTRKDA